MTDNIKAIFVNKRTGKRSVLKRTVMGGLYIERPDYDGLFAWGGTADCSPGAMAVWSEMVNNGDMQVVMSPPTIYHCWHVCFCPRCRSVGGKIWSHSQASWDDHLKRVDNELVFTFPTAKE